MKSHKLFFILLFLCLCFIVKVANAQHKFEIGIGIDPLVVPVNFGTFVESGPGVYDINGKGLIAQSGSAFFTYWPTKMFGISLGAGMRNFRSAIDYAIPDLVYDVPYPVLEGSYQFMGNGWGPSLAILFRHRRWKGRIGIDEYDLHWHNYYSYYGSTGIFYYGDFGEKIAELHVEEKSFWSIRPITYSFLQLQAQYNILDNVYLRVGFETTISSEYPYPYVLEISGYTPETPPENQLFNIFSMRSKLSSFSFGVGYTVGFGKYKRDRINDE